MDKPNKKDRIWAKVCLALYIVVAVSCVFTYISILF